MMVIRSVEPGDLPGLLKLAAETGGGLTSLPVDEATSRRGSPARSRPGAASYRKASRAMSLCWRRAKAARWWASARSRWRWGSTIPGITTGSAPRSMPRRSSTSIRRCRRCFSATIIPAAASCAPCSSTRSGAKRAMAICCRNHASYLWPPFASASMRRWSPRCAG